jgi:hypothetical protein
MGSSSRINERERERERERRATPDRWKCDNYKGFTFYSTPQPVASFNFSEMSLSTIIRYLL